MGAARLRHVVPTEDVSGRHGSWHVRYDALYDATATLGSIDIPALIVAGDQDPVTKPEASERIRAGIPKARLVTLSPAKHLGLIEHHGRYAEAVRGFAHFALAQPLKPSGKNIQW